MKRFESFVGLANFYGRMIPDFATKMLPRNKIRKEENIKNEFCANPLVQPYSLTKKATVTIGLRESYRRGSLTTRTSCDLRLKEVITSRTKLLQY